MDNLDGMNYEQLQQLKLNLDERIKEFRPVRVKIKWKRCGKKTCFCKGGPLDGSWDNLHGPYAFAQFVDHGTRRMRQISLGQHYDAFDIEEVGKEILDRTKYFPVPDADREKMSKGQKEECDWSITLLSWEFEEKYGLRPAADKMSRHTKFWGTRAQYDAYEAELRATEAEKLACRHPWAELYGIGSPAGQKTLEDLLRKNYYLVQI